MISSPTCGSRPVLLLGAFVVLGVILQIVWIHLDERPTTYDDSWYLDNAFQLYHRLTKDGPIGFVEAYTQAFRIKAPLIAVLPLPLFLALGPSLDAALFVNVGFFVLSSIFLYHLGTTWFSPWIGLTAVIVYQTMPLSFGLSRYLLTEYGLAALAIVFIYYLDRVDRSPHAADGMKLGIAGGLGLLMKVTFLFVMAPIVLVLFRRRTDTEYRSLAKALSLAAAVSLVIAGSWYAFNLPHVLEFVSTQFQSSLANYRLPNRALWLRYAVEVAVSAYYFAIAVVVTVALPVWRLPFRRECGFLALWVVPALIVAFIQAQSDFRHILPLMPAIALAISYAFVRVCSRLKPAGFAAALAVFCLPPLVASVELSGISHLLSFEVRVGSVLLFRKEMARARVPDREGKWGQEQLVQIAESYERRTGNIIVGAEHPYFNSTLFNSTKAEQDSPTLFHTLAFEPTFERAVERVHELAPDVILVPLGIRSQELVPFLNGNNQQLLDALQSERLPYRKDREFQLWNAVQVSFYVPR